MAHRNTEEQNKAQNKQTKQQIKTKRIKTIKNMPKINPDNLVCLCITIGLTILNISM